MYKQKYISKSIIVFSILISIMISSDYSKISAEEWIQEVIIPTIHEEDRWDASEYIGMDDDGVAYRLRFIERGVKFVNRYDREVEQNLWLIEGVKDGRVIKRRRIYAENFGFVGDDREVEVRDPVFLANRYIAFNFTNPWRDNGVGLLDTNTMDWTTIDRAAYEQGIRNNFYDNRDGLRHLDDYIPVEKLSSKNGFIQGVSADTNILIYSGENFYYADDNERHFSLDVRDFTHTLLRSEDPDDKSLNFLRYPEVNSPVSNTKAYGYLYDPDRNDRFYSIDVTYGGFRGEYFLSEETYFFMTSPDDKYILYNNYNGYRYNGFILRNKDTGSEVTLNYDEYFPNLDEMIGFKDDSVHIYYRNGSKIYRFNILTLQEELYLDVGFLETSPWGISDIHIPHDIGSKGIVVRLTYTNPQNRYDDSIYSKFVRVYPNSKPLISLQSPMNNSVFYDINGFRDIDVSGYVQDNDGETLTVKANLEGKVKTATISNTSSYQPFNFNFNVVTDNLSVGEHNLVVTVEDANGGIMTVERTIEVRSTQLNDGATLLINTPVTYSTSYSDPENDAKYSEEWIYKHNYTYYENNLGQIPNHNRWISNTYDEFSKPGEYRIQVRAKDNPKNDDNFSEYRKWSPASPEVTIYVHRKPVSDFSVTVNESRNYSIQNLAYDLDRKSTNIGYGNGIKTLRYQWRLTNGIWKNGLPPNPLSDGEIYEVKQIVTDFQDEMATSTKVINLAGYNSPPIAQFNLPQEAVVGETVNLENTSYDPNGDTITSDWLLPTRTDGSHTTSSTWEPSFTPRKVGVLQVHLTVTDPYGETSQITKSITVIPDNAPPIAGFTFQSPIFIGDSIQLQSTATDPDGDSLAYTYEVTKPNNQTVNYNESDVALNNNGNLSIPTGKNDNGNWIVTQYVSDGEYSDSFTDTITVRNLTLQGLVEHTNKWLQRHQELGTSNIANSFFSGERFMLEANVTNYDGNAEVNVILNGMQEDGNPLSLSTTLNNTNHPVHSGSIYEQRMATIGTRLKKGSIVTFQFRSTWSNGMEKQINVTVQIVGDIFEVLNIQRTN